MNAIDFDKWHDMLNCVVLSLDKLAQQHDTGPHGVTGAMQSAADDDNDDGADISDESL